MRIKTFKLVSDAPSDPTKMDTHSIAPWLLLCSPLLVVQISHLGSFIYTIYTHDVRQAERLLLYGTLFWVDGSYFSFSPLGESTIASEGRRGGSLNKHKNHRELMLSHGIRRMPRSQYIEPKKWGQFNAPAACIDLAPTIESAYRARFSSSLMVSSLPWPSSNWTWQSNGRETVIHSRHTYPQHALEKENESVPIYLLSLSLSLYYYTYTHIHSCMEIGRKKSLYRMQHRVSCILRFQTVFAGPVTQHSPSPDFITTLRIDILSACFPISIRV